MWKLQSEDQQIQEMKILKYFGACHCLELGLVD